MEPEIVIGFDFEYFNNSFIYLLGETYYISSLLHSSNYVGDILDDFSLIEPGYLFEGILVPEVDTLALYFEYYNDCAYLVEFYDNLFGKNDWSRIPMPPRYWRIYFGVLDYFVSNIILKDCQYTFWEHFWGTAGRWRPCAWGPLFYQQFLYNQFYFFSNFSDLNNAHVNYELSFYGFVWDSLNPIDTHFDLVFPYFIDTGWEIAPLHVYWLSVDEFVYSLPCGYDNLAFNSKVSVKFRERSFLKIFLWSNYDLLDLNWFFIFLYNISYFFFYWWLPFLCFYSLVINLLVLFFFYKKRSHFFDWFTLKLLKFLYCFLIWYPKLFIISLFSLFSVFLRIVLEQNYWFYGINVFWAYYMHSKLYKIRKSFLHYYLRFACLYFWMLCYFFFFSLYYFMIHFIRTVPYTWVSLYFYLFLISLFYDVFIRVPWLFLKKLWSHYLWIVLHKYLLTHTEVTFKFIAVFDRILKVYHRYFKFKPFNAKYYKHFGFFTSYYKKGVFFSNFDNVCNICFSYLDFFFDIFIFFFCRFWSYVVLFVSFLFENCSFSFFKILRLFISIKIFLLNSLCHLNISGFLDVLNLLVYLFWNFICCCLIILKRVLYIPLFVKNWVFFFFKLTFCSVNLFFFNLVFFLLYYLPIIFFSFFKFLIKYRICFLLLFFIFNIKSLIYFFVISLVIFFNHYICFHGIYYWDVICLIYNPDIKFYNYDFLIRYGEFYVADWVEEYERFFNLYNNSYYRWWQYRWRRRWATRYMFLYCCRVRYYFKFLSNIGSDFWYILLLHWDYSLLYLFLSIIKRLLKFFIWWFFFVFYWVLPKAFFFFIPDFIIFIISFIFYFLSFTSKIFYILVNISFTTVVRKFFDNTAFYFYVYFYKFCYFYLENFYLDVVNILLLKKEILSVNYSSFSNKYSQLSSFICDYSLHNIYCIKVENRSINYFFSKFLILKWYIEVIVYDLLNWEFLRFFYLDFIRYSLFSTIFIEFIMEMFQYFFLVYIFQNLGDSIVDLILKDIFSFFYDWYIYYSDFINIVIFFYFCKEIFQYYADVFCFNIELSRINFIDYSFFIGKKPRFNWFREAAYPNIRRSSSFHHYSLTDLGEIFDSLDMSANIFFTYNFKFYYFWFNYLFHNNFYLIFYTIFLVLFFFKQSKKLFFIDLGYFSNPDYLWNLFRSKNIEEVDWLYKNLNSFVKFKRSLILTGTKYVMSIADFDDFVNWSSTKLQDIKKTTKENIIDVKDTLLDLDKDLSQKVWLKESRRLFNEGHVDFLEFFFSPNYKTYYDNLNKNYLNLIMLVSYGFNRNEILRRLSYYENEIESLDHLFIKQQVSKKEVQDFVKGYFYFLDKNLYNYKLPHWTFHKDFFRYQLIVKEDLDNSKKFSRNNYQIVLDFESFPFSCLIWFWFLPLFFLRFMLLMKGFIGFKTYWMDNSFLGRNIWSHFFDFYFSFVDKLSWIYWDVLGEKRLKRSSQSAPFKLKNKRQPIYSDYYFKVYYEGAYLKWLHENTNNSWNRIWFLLQNRRFYGFNMLHSSIYSNIGFFFFFLFCICIYKLLQLKRIFFSNEKNDLMFFSRILLVRIWRLENYLKFKSKVRSFIIKHVTFNEK